jgi:hypothetical protein
MNPPSPDEFRKGYMVFQQHERRDAMYKTVIFLVNHFWDHPADIADSLGVLLLTWNQALLQVRTVRLPTPRESHCHQAIGPRHLQVSGHPYLLFGRRCGD